MESWIITLKKFDTNKTLKTKTEFYKKLIKNEKIENTYKNQNYQKSLKNRNIK